jgi:hypothetical protein
MKLTQVGMNRLLLVLVVLIGIAFTSCKKVWPNPPHTGKAYYVAPDGSDSNFGTREGPFATPGYGSKQMQAGDTLVIFSGRYTLTRYDDDVVTPPSGDSTAWTVIRGEGASQPVLAGGANLLTAIELNGRSYVRVENLEITHSGNADSRDGLEIMGEPASHIVLERLSIHHIDEMGMNIQDVEDLLVSGCRVSYCGFGALGGPAGEHGGWRNVVIEGCSLSYSGHYYQGGPGPSPYDRPDGFGIEAADGPIEIANTVAAHNRGDGLDSKARNTYIHGCIVENNSCDGVKLWGTGSRLENCLIYGRGDGSSQATDWAALVIQTELANSTFEVVNTTIDDSVGQNYLMYSQYEYPSVPITLDIRNTVFCARGENSPVYLSGAVNQTWTNNLFYAPRCDFVLTIADTANYDSQSVTQLGTGTFYGDPRFVQTGFGTAGDYHVPAGSPAADAGTAVGAPAVDLEGSSRPQGNGFDIGAYER